MLEKVLGIRCENPRKSLPLVATAPVGCTMNSKGDMAQPLRDCFCLAQKMRGSDYGNGGFLPEMLCMNISGGGLCAV